MVAHTFTPATGEAEAGGSLSFLAGQPSLIDDSQILVKDAVSECMAGGS